MAAAEPACALLLLHGRHSLLSVGSHRCRAINGIRSRSVALGTTSICTLGKSFPRGLKPSSSSSSSTSRHERLGSAIFRESKYPPMPVRCMADSASTPSPPSFPAAEVRDVAISVTKPPSPDVLKMWKTADAVCFDVDSTVCEDEGIDELAAFCGAGEAVAAWTARAMGGGVPFEVALASRLDLFKPSSLTVADLLKQRPPRLTPGIVDLIRKLHSRGTDVYLVSGGFRQMIEPVAALLGIPKERIFANNLLFKENGEFAGFDANEPTSRSGGKAIVIEKIKREYGYEKLVMVGDGATDLEARRPGGAEMFVCFGGVVARPKVIEGADWFVSNFADLVSAA